MFYSDKTTIKCKIDLIDHNDVNEVESGSKELEVFLKAAEYAICQNSLNPSCLFTWSLEGLPVVESIEPVWDPVEYFYYVKITGTGFL